MWHEVAACQAEARPHSYMHPSTHPLTPSHAPHARTRPAPQLQRSFKGRFNPVAIKDPEDQAFAAEVAASVKAWLADVEGGGDSLALPPCNAYRRAVIYQELDKPQFGEGFRGFWVQKVGGWLGATWGWGQGCRLCARRARPHAHALP